jgi:hypothetical protein
LSHDSWVVACGKLPIACGKLWKGLGRICGSAGESARLKIRITNFEDYVTIY